jgi:hypothetical protein
MTWGTVYDAATKRPIPYAKVRLLGENRRVLETRVADSVGRYGFLTAPLSMRLQRVVVSILASAAGYTFPSRTPITVDTFVYGNIYHGEEVAVRDDTSVNFDIPMDPLHPHAAPVAVTSPSITFGASTAALADIGFWLGIVMVPLSFAMNQNPFTFGILCLFLGTASLRVFGIRDHPFGTVTDAKTGRAMPFALITLDDTTGRRVAYAVADERGRYFMIAPRGSYRLTAYTPGALQPARRDVRTVHVGKGWITQALVF